MPLERQKGRALEQEQARLQGVIARRNRRLGEWTEQQQALQQPVRELLARGEAFGAQNAALAGDVATLRGENARLRAGQSGGAQQGASVRRPPAFVEARARQPATPKGRRRKRAAIHNRGRRLGPERVTRTVAPAVESCPHCATALAGGWAQRRVQVIDLPPPAPVEVTGRVLVTRRCPGCRRLGRPRARGWRTDGSGRAASGRASWRRSP